MSRPVRRPLALVPLLFVLLAILLSPRQSSATTRIDCEAIGDQVTCQVDVSEVFDTEVRLIMERGFTNDLVYRFYLMAEHRDEPIVIESVTFAQVYRLYTNVYYISREGENGYVTAEDWSTATAAMGVFTVQFQLAPPLEQGGYVVACLLQINPLSEEHMAEAARWISSSRGGFRLFGMAEQSFFGSFVQLFLNTDLESAEVVRHFRSTHFEIVP